MNKMLIAVFDSEKAADAGLHALRRLHAEGDITLYGTGVIAKDTDGKVRLVEAVGPGPVGVGVGLAVGSLIGLLGGPVGLAVGALTGTVVGAVRDYWAAGVGLDFVDAAALKLQPGKVALVAEIEEEWVIPVDAALEPLGGTLFRRGRSDVIAAQFDHDIAALKGEIAELETESAQATGAAKTALQGKLTAVRRQLEQAMAHAAARVEALRHEAETKAAALKAQLELTQGEAKARLEERAKRVGIAYHARRTKLSQAWELTKEALTA